MWSYWLCASPGTTHRSTGSKNHLVCSAEKVSVDMVKITTDHTIAGHHAHNHASPRGAGVFARISDKLGAGRGLRHGCESTASAVPICSTKPFNLFHAIVRRFLGNNDVVHVALSKSRRCHANEAALFLEFFQRARANITHSAAQSANQLVCQRA